MALGLTSLAAAGFTPVGMVLPSPAATLSMVAVERSAAIPFLKKPPALDGSMAGDKGFDPLGFSTTITELGGDLNYVCPPAAPRLQHMGASRPSYGITAQSDTVWAGRVPECRDAKQLMSSIASAARRARAPPQHTRIHGLFPPPQQGPRMVAVGTRG